MYLADVEFALTRSGEADPSQARMESSDLVIVSSSDQGLRRSTRQSKAAAPPEISIDNTELSVTRSPLYVRRLLTGLVRLQVILVCTGKYHPGGTRSLRNGRVPERHSDRVWIEVRNLKERTAHSANLI